MKSVIVNNLKVYLEALRACMNDSWRGYDEMLDRAINDLVSCISALEKSNLEDKK